MTGSSPSLTCPVSPSPVGEATDRVLAGFRHQGRSYHLLLVLIPDADGLLGPVRPFPLPTGLETKRGDSASVPLHKAFIDVMSVETKKISG